MKYFEEIPRSPTSNCRHLEQCMGSNSTKKSTPDPSDHQHKIQLPQPNQLNHPNSNPAPDQDQQKSNSSHSRESTLSRRKGSRRGSCISGGQKVTTWAWSGPAGDHSPYPVDNIPYQGLEVLYCFVDVLARFQIMKNQINLGPTAVTTNVEQYLNEISDCYKEGFTLNKFVRVPGVKMITEVSDWSVYQPYQAILSQPINKPNVAETKEDWQLTVEKRILSTRTLAFDETDHENDLLNTIHRYASAGARLTCAEPVGYVRSDSPNQQYGIMGVELFFNVPRHHVEVFYTYHTVTIPAMYHIIPDDTQSLQQVVCDADFFGQLKVFLDSGWRLVDICMDTSAIADAYKLRATSKRVETIWIFEKETGKLCDETPVYEGVLIEYLHKVKVSMEGERPCRDWRPVIAGMGLSGWELATVIQTPLLVQSSFTTYTMKLLFIFQRPLTPFQLFTKYGINVAPDVMGRFGGRGRPGFGSGSGTPQGGRGRGAGESRSTLPNHESRSPSKYNTTKISNGQITSNHIQMDGHVNMRNSTLQNQSTASYHPVMNNSFDDDSPEEHKQERRSRSSSRKSFDSTNSRKEVVQDRRGFNGSSLDRRSAPRDVLRDKSNVTLGSHSNRNHSNASHSNGNRDKAGSSDGSHIKTGPSNSRGSNVSYSKRGDVRGEGILLDNAPIVGQKLKRGGMDKDAGGANRMYYYRTQRLTHHPDKWTVGGSDDNGRDDKANDDDDDDDDDYPTISYSTNGWSTKSSSSENGNMQEYGKLSVFTPIGIPLT